MEKIHGYEFNLKGEDLRLDRDYNNEQLTKGINIEKEHTTNEIIAKIIAKDHLDEFSNYYTGLDTMENELEKHKDDDNFDIDDLDSFIDNINNDETINEEDKTNEKEHVLIVKYRTFEKDMKKDPLVKLIAGVGILGNCGHSYEIVLDPDAAPTDKIKCGWDGDGSDHIFEISRDDEILESDKFGTLFK